MKRIKHIPYGVCDENENLCISPMSIGVIGSVSGTLRWTDDQNFDRCNNKSNY